jgi:hypothetical protein
MQAYLTFLIQTIGLNSIRYDTTTNKDTPPLKKSRTEDRPVEGSQNNGRAQDDISREIFSKDPNIERACHSIICCGGLKVLPMLRPVLEAWLLVDKRVGSTLHVVHIRVALTFLVSMIMTAEDKVIDTSVDLSHFDEPVSDAIFATLWISPVSGNCSDQQNITPNDENLARQLKPAMVCNWILSSVGTSQISCNV